MRIVALFLVFIFQMSAVFAQRAQEQYAPGITIGYGTILDSATRQPAGNFYIRATSPKNSKLLFVNGIGMIIGDLIPGVNETERTLADGTPENIRFTSASENYRVTGWSIKTLQHGKVRDENGKKTGEQYWMTDVTIFVAMKKGMKRVTVSGTVLDSLEKKPRAGVHVLLFYARNDSLPPDTSITDAGGNFFFSRIVPDTTQPVFVNFPLGIDDEKYILLYVRDFYRMNKDSMRSIIFVRRGIRLIPVKD